MTTLERMALIAALEDYARWLRSDLDRPSPEQVEAARKRVMDMLREGKGDLYTALRNQTEDDIVLMFHRAHISLPITTPAEALELIQRAVDVATGEDDAVENVDAAMIEASERKRNKAD